MGRSRNSTRLQRCRNWGAGVAAILTFLLVPTLTAHAQTTITVAATTPDLKSIAEAVSGNSVRVVTLIPPGADPEAFEPSPHHLALLRQSSLILRIGLGYEHWLDRLLQQAGRQQLLPGGEGYVDLSAQIALLEVRGRSISIVPGHAHGSGNPHYWLDPANGEVIAGEIAAALIRLLPERRASIEVAHARFIDDLKQRTARWLQLLEPHRGVPLISYHNTWPYFARRFRLNIVDAIEQKEGVPPSPARLVKLTSEMRAKQVRAILHEPFQPPDISRLLSTRTGARVVVLAPSVGSVPEASDYLKLLEYNVTALVTGLSGGTQ